MREQDKNAIRLYAMASRDVMDFVEAVAEEDSVRTLGTLYKMLTLPSDRPGHDQELNDLIAPTVQRRLQQLGVAA